MTEKYLPVRLLSAVFHDSWLHFYLRPSESMSHRWTIDCQLVINYHLITFWFKGINEIVLLTCCLHHSLWLLWIRYSMSSPHNLILLGTQPHLHEIKNQFYLSSVFSASLSTLTLPAPGPLPYLKSIPWAHNPEYFQLPPKTGSKNTVRGVYIIN